ncbi:Outer membrane protein assembly factor BamA [Hymenobacter daecheongensis DSM 21074]|uniref:Outer membrane protein assembly factor BamA n=1 Tax=Hymenobacter daecheongensis DSM 21074 TaxID=1121955 RepID=A0A1M6K2B0_9BACT|nr:BamA/TamA family outer membrane protein [Hymenobacter daecheongensis]SHJ53083.1 Outer membrane protein assembly factor BamA [Hymenobacter daecheongensis DSM 21074]
MPAALTGALLLLLVGCSPLRLLGPKQKLLSRVRLVGVEQADAERIAALYQQKPNTSFPLPKLAIYQLGRTVYNKERLQTKLARIQKEFDERLQAARPDSVKVGKLLVRREKRTSRLQRTIDKGNAIMRIGEPPVIYDSALTRRTVEQIGIFLKSKGFFRSKVTATDTVADRRFSLGRLLGGPDTVHNRRVTVTYRITENQPFKYSQLDFDIPDSAIARRVVASQPASLLHVGDQYDEEVIGNERARLETLLKNQGYFDFRQQYVTLEADTSFAPATVRLRTLIADPAGRRHYQYTIRRVRFIADAGLTRFGQTRDTLVQDSVYYLAYKHQISPKTLDRKLTVRPGDTYSLSSTLLTQRQLSNLDVFRFNTVNYLRVRNQTTGDTTRRQLDAVINASPAKKYQETTEAGATYVALLLGPFANERLKIRNVFGGAEVLELGVRAGFEGQYTRTGQVEGLPAQSVYTTQLGANANLVLPQFLVPWRTNRFLTQYNPRTRINAAYNYVLRPEYTRTNLEATYDYIWQRSAFHQYVLTPVAISLVNTPRLDDAFRDTLNSLARRGSPLKQSFSRQLVPTFNATSLYNSNDFNQTRNAYYLRLFAEAGGLTKSLYETYLKDKLGLNVYNFAKLNADYRRYYKIGPKSFVVYRLNAGIVSALSKSSVEVVIPSPTIPGESETVIQRRYVIPYDKYFFAGGASSVRAWRPRRLGPGTYTSTKTDNGETVQNFDLEQPGEILMEGSLEYRFPLYSFINGALFTDFGNVWTLNDDNLRPGAQFQANRFYRQFAVGSGVGVRFDFTFLILRLDVATKVYDPTALGNKFVISRFSLSDNQTAFNIGIGYPF